jgi:hypothetical protein
VREPEPEPEPEPVREPELVLAAVGAPASEPEPAPAAGSASGSARRVWVVDGRPRYHAQDCLIIKGQKSQSVPFDQAVEDGFMACSLCQRNH